MLDKLTPDAQLWLGIAALIALVLIVHAIAETISSFSKHAYEGDEYRDAQLDKLTEIVAYAHDTYHLLEQIDGTLTAMRDALDRIDERERAADETPVG